MGIKTCKVGKAPGNVPTLRRAASRGDIPHPPSGVLGPQEQGPPQQHPRGGWGWGPVSSPPTAVLLRGGEGLIKLPSFSAQHIRVLLEAALG